MSKNKTILLIDAEPDFLKALKIRLKSRGYNILEASDGMEGLKVARKEKPDLIILDIMLPKLNGYCVARFLKFDDRYKSIPIIFLTAKNGDKDRNNAMKTGADAYITKPFKSKELLHHIQKLTG